MILAGIHRAASPLRSAPTLAPAARATSGPLQVANPQLDPIVARQARFRVTGTGPVSQRSIEPASIGAAQLVARDDVATDAVRRVLRLVEHAAGGPDASSRVRLNGVSFSDSPAGLAATTYRAHLDDDATFRAGVAGMSSAELQRQARLLGERKVQQTSGLLANVVSGWMNLGPTASNALLGRSGDAGTQQVGDAVRILLHETMHVVEPGESGLSREADTALQEALAEVRSTDLQQLRQARGVLGLDGVVSDAALGAALRIRPYRLHQQALDEVFRLAGVRPGSSGAVELASRPAKAVVGELVERIANSAGDAPAETRSLLDGLFTEVARRG